MAGTERAIIIDALADPETGEVRDVGSTARCGAPVQRSVC
jgi:hypothetical protein